MSILLDEKLRSLDFQEAMKRGWEQYFHYWQEIMSQREEILVAFIAKYGCAPDEVEQVEERDVLGNSHWYIRKKGTVAACE